MRRIIFWSLVSVALCPIVSVRGTTPSPYRPDADTVMLYHFNETSGVADDASTNNYDGTVGSKVVRGTNGMPGFGTAYNFASNTSPNAVTTATIADGTVLSPFNLQRYTNGFTIEAWVRNVRTGTADRATIASIGVGSGRQAELYVTTDGKLQFYDLDGGSKINPVSAVLQWQNGVWYHVAAVIAINGANASCTIYQTPAGTGVPQQVGLKSTTSWAGFTSEAGGYYFTFGTCAVSVERSLGGDMDEVRFSGVPRTKFDTLSTRGTIITIH